jgi:predicted ester cyclase
MWVPGQRRGSVCVRADAVRPKRIAQRYYDEVLTARRVDVLDTLLAPGFIGYDPIGATIERADYIGGVRMVLTGFGRLVVRIEDQVAERDRVTTRWSATGTHTGPFAGIVGTGREVSMSGIDIHRVDGEQLAELWEQLDLASMLAQLL